MLGPLYRRQQEYAVRAALGVGRLALFRQVSAESLLLALLGGGVGMALAWGTVGIFKAIGGHAIPRLDAVTTGWPVLAVWVGRGVGWCSPRGSISSDAGFGARSREGFEEWRVEIERRTRRAADPSRGDDVSRPR